MIDTTRPRATRTTRRLPALLVTFLLAAGGTVAVPTTAQAGLATALPDTPDSFSLRGSGYGHGVGMPQYGAYQLSRQGRGALGILEHYYTGTSARFRDTRPDIAVQVYGPDPGGSSAGDRGRRTRIRIDDGRWRIRGPRGRTVVSGLGGRELVVSTASGRPTVTFRGRTHRATVLRLEWAGTRAFKPRGQRAVVSVAGAHGRYRYGHLRLTARSGVPNVVTVLRVNTEYLYGLAEMPASWGLSGGGSALRAQAITARSYALRADKRRSCACHVVDDVRDQYFSGWLARSSVWQRAVDATVNHRTRARVLTRSGRPLVAHYYSSSGGRTANSEDVWSATLPYERSVGDPYSARAPGNSWASWSRTLTQTRARALFGLVNVASIRVTSRYTSGQVRTIAATSPAGRTVRITGKADEIRRRVGAATRARNLPAAWITRIVGR